MIIVTYFILAIFISALVQMDLPVFLNNPAPGIKTAQTETYRQQRERP
jgi:hypothetical protein